MARLPVTPRMGPLSAGAPFGAEAVIPPFVGSSLIGASKLHPPAPTGGLPITQYGPTRIQLFSKTMTNAEQTVPSRSRRDAVMYACEVP